MALDPVPVEAESITEIIRVVRGKRVILDSDLAVLYGTTTGRLNEQVKRNARRFPSDFMFQLTREEVTNLMSQIAISSHGGRRRLPFAFTEQGIAMLSSVLHTARAIDVNIAVMRTFVRMRSVLIAHDELAQRLDRLEAKYDSNFRIVFDAIRELMNSDSTPTRRIGFDRQE